MSRRRAERFGRLAELMAVVCLVFKGYRIHARRARTAAGEIDLVAARGEYLAFVEVKARPTLAKAQLALGSRQRDRILRAAASWRAAHTRLAHLTPRYDLVLVVPWRWPVHHRAAWLPEGRYAADLL